MSIAPVGHNMCAHPNFPWRPAATGARRVVSGDQSTIPEASTVADEGNKLGRFDAPHADIAVGSRGTDGSNPLPSSGESCKPLVPQRWSPESTQVINGRRHRDDQPETNHRHCGRRSAMSVSRHNPSNQASLPDVLRADPTRSRPRDAGLVEVSHCDGSLLLS